MKLTVAEVAEKLRVCGPTVRSWLAQGLPHYRFGLKPGKGKIMIEEEDLAAFIERCRVEGPPPRPAPKKKEKFTHVNVK